MGAIGIIAHYSKLKDVSFSRSDGSPPSDLDSPIWYTSASRLFMGPVSGGGGGGGGSFSLGVSTGGNTLGQTGVTGSRVVLAGLGAITLSQLTDANGASISLSAPQQSVQTQSRFNLTLAGNTAGALQEVSSGTLTLAGGNGITLSQNGNAITISGGGGFTQSDQTLGLFAEGNTTGQSSSTTRDARSVSLRGDGAVSVGFSNGSIRISAPLQSVQPETQTFIGGVAASDATYTSGTVNLLGLGNVTVRSTTGQAIQISVPAQSVQPETQTFLGGISASDTLYTSGTVRFTGVGGGVTVSTNTGQRVDISVAAPVAQTGTQFSAGVSGGNTSGHSGTVAGRLVLAGGNNVTLSGSTNGASMSVTVSAANQTVQTQNLHNVTLSGNTAGAMAQISSGTMTLAGGNRITLSQAGNAVTISGADAQTGISSIVASDATYTSGSVQFTGSGIVTVRSSANQRVVIDASQSVQTQNMVALTLSGNTSGAQALMSSGTVTIAGGNNITVSQNGNGFTISGPNVGGAQTGISGLANSETTYTSGSVTLSELGAITIRSTTGNHFQFSVNPQSVQPETQTFIGGISASDTLYTSGTVRFTGVGGGITVSSNTGQRVDLSVAAPVNFSAGVSNLGNTAGDTGATGTRLVFAGGQSITVSQSTNANGGTITISGASTSQSVQTQGQMSAGVSTGGNTAGDTGVTGTRLVFVGSNNITLSQATAAAGGTITISGPTAAAQTNQTLGMYALGNTTGQSSSTTMDARTVSIRGDGIVSVGYSGGSLRISATQSVQPETQTFIAGIANSQTTYTSGTVSLSELGAITIRSTTGNQFQLSVNAQTGTQFSAGLSNIGNTLGDTVTVGGRLILAGIGEVTLSGSSNGVSQTISISAPAQSVQTQGILSAGVSTGGNTAGNTQVSTGSRLVIAGAGMITASQATAAGASTISLSATQSVQSLGMYAVQNTTGQSSSTTMDARTLSIAGDGEVSVGYSNGSLRISAPVQTVESQSIGMSNVGNTSGTTGMASGGQVRFVFAGGNNITLSQSLNGASGTITISAPNLGAGAMSVGVSNLGNTAGSTGVTGTRLVLVGTNGVTLSQSTDANGGTVSFSAGGGGGFSAGVSTGGNTAGATGVSGSQVVLVGSGVVSLSQTTGANGNTVSFLAPATSSLVGVSGIGISTNGSTISVYQTNRSEYMPFADAPIVTGAQGQGTLHIQPLYVPNVQHDRILLGMQISNATNSSNSITISAWVGLYTKNASSISLVSSISASTNFTGSGTVGSYSLYGGPKWMSIPWTNTITENDYYLGIIIRTTTGGGAGHTVSQLCVSRFTNSAWSGILGAGSNATDQLVLGQGVYSATTSAIPNSIGFTQIQGSGTQVLRQPIFQLRSGTV